MFQTSSSIICTVFTGSRWETSGQVQIQSGARLRKRANLMNHMVQTLHQLGRQWPRILNYEFHLHLLNHWCIQTSNTARRIFRCRHRSTKKCTRGWHNLKHDADGEYDVGCEQRASVQWECQRHRRCKKDSRIRWICCCRHLNQRDYRVKKSRLCF